MPQAEETQQAMDHDPNGKPPAAEIRIPQPAHVASHASLPTGRHPATVIASQISPPSYEEHRNHSVFGPPRSFVSVEGASPCNPEALNFDIQEPGPDGPNTQTPNRRQKRHWRARLREKILPEWVPELRVHETNYVEFRRHRWGGRIKTVCCLILVGIVMVVAIPMILLFWLGKGLLFLVKLLIELPMVIFLCPVLLFSSCLED